MVLGIAQLADEERVAVLQQGTEVAREYETVTCDGFDLLEGGVLLRQGKRPLR